MVDMKPQMFADERRWGKCSTVVPDGDGN